LSERTFLLPDVGEGLVEAEIVTWKVSVGDVVTLNQPLVDIETAKATVELPSPFAGTVVALHGNVGDVMEVGKPLVVFDVGANVGAWSKRVLEVAQARAIPVVVHAFEPSEPGHAVMDQRDEAFVPHVLAITTGTTVDFTNSDRIYHNVFSLSKTEPFDLGRYAVGHSKPQRFDHPGIVRVFCDIHSHMNAFILVFSHPFFAITDADGRYHIDNVPPGTYNVIAWNEGVSSEPRSVTVPDAGVADLDFTLR